jgi:large conductance mechanosensitive channel
MLEEFKKFALRGNVLDMAIGVIIGAAFGKIITALVNNIIMPPLGIIFGKIDFSNLFINLGDKPVTTLKAAQEANVPVIAYGLFLNAVIDFLIVAFVLFIIINRVNKLFPAPADPVKRLCPYCQTEIPEAATRCPHCTSQLEPVHTEVKD